MVEHLTDTALRIVADLAGQGVDEATRLDDLSMDSLALIEVLLTLEDAGIVVHTPDDLAGLETVGALLEHIEPSGAPGQEAPT